MEATLLHSMASPCKRARNPKRGFAPSPPLLPLPTSGGGGGSSRGSSLSPAYKKHNSKPSKSKKVVFAEGISVNFIPRLKEEEFSGTAFPSAPPPSSLPMPRFSMKPKMSCRVEANTAGGGLIDAYATDNLCRLLNLR